MTRPALRAAGAVLFLCTLPALAAAPKAAPAAPAVKPGAAVAPMPSPTQTALQTAFTELMAGQTSGNYAQWLDSLPGFQFSPATSRLLVAQLGTSRLFSVQRHSAPPGGRDYSITVPPLRHSRADGSSIAWAAMRGQITLQADGVTLAVNGSAPSLINDDKTMRVALRDMTFSSSGRRGDGKLSFGEGKFEIGNIDMTVKSNNTGVAMTGLFGQFSTIDQGKAVAMRYESGIRSIEVGGEKIENIHFAAHIEGIDKAALESFSAHSAEISGKIRHQQADLDAGAKRAALAPLMHELRMAFLTPGASLSLDDTSFSYRGSTAQLRGEAHFDNATPADLADSQLALKKIVAHLDIQMPTAMLRAFAENMARKKLVEQGNSDAATIAKAADVIYDTFLKQAVGSGFVRVDGDMLVSSVDLRDGQLRINGKPMPLPKPAAPVAAVDSGAMRARRIPEKCVLPDYPAEVAAQDRALAMAMQLMVTPDGSVGSLTLARSSGFPAYDQTVLAAAAQCKYIPALRAGKPVAVSELWEIVRVPGSAHP